DRVHGPTFFPGPPTIAKPPQERIPARFPCSESSLAQSLDRGGDLHRTSGFESFPGGCFGIDDRFAFPARRSGRCSSPPHRPRSRLPLPVYVRHSREHSTNVPTGYWKISDQTKHIAGRPEEIRATTVRARTARPFLAGSAQAASRPGSIRKTAAS